MNRRSSWQRWSPARRRSPRRGPVKPGRRTRRSPWHQSADQSDQGIHKSRWLSRLAISAECNGMLPPDATLCCRVAQFRYTFAHSAHTDAPCRIYAVYLRVTDGSADNTTATLLTGTLLFPFLRRTPISGHGPTYRDQSVWAIRFARARRKFMWRNEQRSRLSWCRYGLRSKHVIPNVLRNG